MSLTDQQMLTIELHSQPVPGTHISTVTAYTSITFPLFCGLYRDNYHGLKECQLKTVLKSAVKNNLIRMNPVLDVEVP